MLKAFRADQIAPVSPLSGQARALLAKNFTLAAEVLVDRLAHVERFRKSTARDPLHMIHNMAAGEAHLHHAQVIGSRA